MVEADPSLAAALKARVPEWPSNGNSVEVLGVAAGDSSETMPFYVGAEDTQGSLTQKGLELASAMSGQQVSVLVEPLDKLFEPEAGTLIKMDVEGFEYRALSGARRLLAGKEEDGCAGSARVIAELHGWGDKDRGKYPIHVLWLMYRRGFGMKRLGRSFSYDFRRRGALARTLMFARCAPPIAGRYAIRAMGLKPLIDRLLGRK